MVYIIKSKTIVATEWFILVYIKIIFVYFLAVSWKVGLKRSRVRFSISLDSCYFYNIKPLLVGDCGAVIFFVTYLFFISKILDSTL